MNNQMVHTPAGVRDLYGPELKRKQQIGRLLMECTGRYGYQQIEPPTFEFFDIFSREVGTTASKDLFKFFDKEGNTLVLRPDFTPSAARCAVKYFLEDDMPVRLSYQGSAFSNTAELMGKLKETTQLGAELIGDDSVDADAEMLCLVIEALRSCGFEDFTLSVGEMDFFKGICREAKLDEETILSLREQISLKNYYAAEELLREKGLDSEYGSLFLDAGNMGSIEELKDVRDRVHNSCSAQALDRLMAIYEQVKEYGLERYISFDLGMLSKFHYYTGMIFKAYTYGVGDAIVKGGRYDDLLSHFGKNAPAVGCVFLLDELMGALSSQGKLPAVAEAKTVWVLYDEAHRSSALNAILSLRDEGKAACGILMKEKSAEMYRKAAEAAGAESMVFAE